MSLAAAVCLGALVGGCSTRADIQLEYNKNLVRRYYEHVVSSGDIDAVSGFVASDYAYVHLGVKHKLGIEGEKEHIRGVRRTYPDLQLTVKRQIAEGDWVASVVTMRGTHSGEWMNMTPTHRPIEVTAVNVDRVVDGRIVEHGRAANLLEAFLRAGAIKIADPVDAAEVNGN